MSRCIAILFIRTCMLLSTAYLVNWILVKFKYSSTDIKSFFIALGFHLCASIGIFIRYKGTGFLEYLSESIIFIVIFITYIFTKKIYLK